MLMTMIPDSRNQFTPREAEQMAYDERMFDKQAEFQLEQLRIEAKWGSWFRIPLTIIKLPVYCLFGIGFILSTVTKHELPENFWRFMR